VDLITEDPDIGHLTTHTYSRPFKVLDELQTAYISNSRSLTPAMNCGWFDVEEN
jgi:hypothetical protein